MKCHRFTSKVKMFARAFGQYFWPVLTMTRESYLLNLTLLLAVVDLKCASLTPPEDHIESRISHSKIGRKRLNLRKKRTRP